MLSRIGALSDPLPNTLFLRIINALSRSVELPSRAPPPDARLPPGTQGNSSKRTGGTLRAGAGRSIAQSCRRHRDLGRAGNGHYNPTGNITGKPCHAGPR